MGFDRIKQILNQGLDAWETAKGPADLSRHAPNFGKPSWATKAALLAAVGHGKRLIQPEVIGTPGVPGSGKGNLSNLVIDLRTGFNGPPTRMPEGGPFIPDSQIQEIEDWINGGCPD
jgi:hypothetical protein